MPVKSVSSSKKTGLKSSPHHKMPAKKSSAGKKRPFPRALKKDSASCALLREFPTICKNFKAHVKATKGCQDVDKESTDKLSEIMDSARQFKYSLEDQLCKLVKERDAAIEEASALDDELDERNDLVDVLNGEWNEAKETIRNQDQWLYEKLNTIKRLEREKAEMEAMHLKEKKAMEKKVNMYETAELRRKHGLDF